MTGNSPMPFAFGIHPYFLVAAADKAGARIATHATQAFDNVTKTIVPFRGFDLTANEVDLHLLDHGSSDSALDWAELGRETVTWGQHVRSSNQPVPEQPVRDALAGVDIGSRANRG